jgi:hypothetical protein
MDSIELIQKIWIKIYNPRSCVPDIETGRVRTILSQVLAESLRESVPVDSEVEGYVLATVLVGPVSCMDLNYEWFDFKYRKYLLPPEDGDYESKGYKQAYEKHHREQDGLEQKALREVTDAIKKLQEKGLIEVRGNQEEESMKLIYLSSGMVESSRIR